MDYNVSKLRDGKSVTIKVDTDYGVRHLISFHPASDNPEGEHKEAWEVTVTYLSDDQRQSVRIDRFGSWYDAQKAASMSLWTTF